LQRHNNVIITVGGIKGGSGRSTISTNFACIAASFKAKVLLVDTDEQETATDFAAVRREDHPDAVRFTCIKLTGSNVRAEILKRSRKYKHVIIDTGGRDTTSQRAAISVSNVLLVPFTPRSFDIWTLNAVESLVEEMRTVNPVLQAYTFLNRSDPQGQSRENDEAATLLKQVRGLTFLDAPIASRKVYAHAASQGLAVTELTGAQRNLKAIDEIITLARSR
jgi:chromosome partitioning protein